MKRIMMLVVVMTLPFSSYGGKTKDGIGADGGKHFAEPGLEKFGKSMEASSENIANSINRAADSFDEGSERVDGAVRHFVEAQAFFLLIAVPLVVTGIAIKEGSWYAYHYANGSLNAELEKYKAEQEEHRRKAEEEKVKNLLAVQEAQRLKRNAEIETEFNKCFVERFQSPTRKRNGIPSSCELQGIQLVTTGKYKSMQELKEYYKS